MINFAQNKIKVNPAYFSMAFSIICFLYYNVFVSSIVWNISYIAVSIFSLLWLLFKKNKKNVQLILWCILIILCGISSGIHSGDFNMSLYFKSFCYVILAYFLVNNNLSLRVIKIFFYASFLILTFVLLNRNIDVNQYFTSLSRNYFSVLLLPPLVLYYDYFCKVNSQKISIIPSACYLFVSLIAIGRGGIITAFALFILTFIFASIKRGINKKILLFVILMIFLTAIMLNPSILQPYISRFTIMGLESNRTYIWSEYIRLCMKSFSNFWFGAANQDMYGIPILNMNEFNLHNSYLQMHFQYGIVFTLIYMICLAKSLFKCFVKKQYLILIIAVTFLFRAFIDQLGYAFYTEIFFYFFMMYGDKEIDSNSLNNIQSDKTTFIGKDNKNA